MKKVLSLALVVAAGVALSGCTADSKTTPATVKPAPSPSTPK